MYDSWFQMAKEEDISLNLIDHSQNDYICFSVCQAMDIVPEIITGIISEVIEGKSSMILIKCILASSYLESSQGESSMSSSFAAEIELIVDNILDEN